jgi:hypothetical protein
MEMDMEKASTDQTKEDRDGVERDLETEADSVRLTFTEADENIKHNNGKERRARPQKRASASTILLYM